MVEQTGLLETIDIQWNPQQDAFERGMRSITRCYESHGDLEVPVQYQDDDGAVRKLPKQNGEFQKWDSPLNFVSVFGVWNS